MNVRLDEPGEHVSAACVDHARVWRSDVRVDRSDTAFDDRYVPFDDVEAVVHRQNDAAAKQQRHQALVFRLETSDLRLGGVHCIEAEWALPCLTAMSSARMLTAISCGVTA